MSRGNKSNKYQQDGRRPNQSTTESRPTSFQPSRSNQSEANVLTPREESLNLNISEIILTLHKNKQFVSPVTVETELLKLHGKTFLRDLRVDLRHLTPLQNLRSRVKAINQFIQIFKQLVNICTLHDFRSIIEDFLEVQNYDDLHLGPYEANPDVIELFNYKPANADDPVPEVTTGDVVQLFIEFSDQYDEERDTLFKNFIVHLTTEYDFESINELGLFCRSLPYLLQVSGKVKRSLRNSERQMQQDALQQVIVKTKENLERIQEQVSTEQQLSSLTRKMNPVNLFTHLLSVVEKYFHILPYQSLTYATLMLLKNNDLLRCLLNLSILLGTIEEPEAIKEQLKRFYVDLGPNQTLQQFEFLMKTHQEFTGKKEVQKIDKNRKKIKALMHEWEQSNKQMTTDNSMAEMQSFRMGRPRPLVSLESLCLEVFQYLHTFQTLPTVEQLSTIERSLCENHHTNNFSDLYYDENDPNDYISLLDFLLRFRNQIDPENKLSIYDEPSCLYDLETLRMFIQQLNIFNNATTEIIQEHALREVQQQAETERLSIVDKAIKHRFGQSISSRQAKSILEEMTESNDRQQKFIIRYEESLVDKDNLNRLDICPSSLNVDENQLCEIISTAPVLINLPTWLGWNEFFQPKYGDFKSFILKNLNVFDDLLLLETSALELVRIPLKANQVSFQEHLKKNNIRQAVADLCSIIVQEGSIIHFSFKVFQTFIETWLNQLRTVAILKNDLNDAFSCVLEFLFYLPSLIGQTRFVKETLLEPFDKIFQAECQTGPNPRAALWNHADRTQRTKLEHWGYLLEINEWKNERKWSGESNDDDEKLIEKYEKSSVIPKQVDQIVPNSPKTKSELQIPSSPSVNPIHSVTRSISQISTDAFAHIESIRKNLGADRTVNSKDQAVVDNLHGILERSLEKLSTDLYSEEGHFVLELIQNADDNQYEVMIPTLCFFVSTQEILVCNNEVGFSRENISAICNVGASTKGKHKKGYTGHKGIGFKSVFMISHQPEIHSGNYRIKFDTKNGKEQMGYILPIWLNTDEHSHPELNRWSTSIRLPIRPDVEVKRLMNKFENVQGKLLLFLNRLRRIEIIDRRENNLSKRIFTRVDYADGNIIELQEQTVEGDCSRHLWLVVKNFVVVPENIKNKLRDIKGPIDETTIALAFPLEGITENSTSALRAQPIFAYLPLLSCGFRFILQADFEIPASRQDLRRDNLWNEWLKSQMPQLMYSAYEQFKQLPELIADLNLTNERYVQPTAIQAIKHFLKFLPASYEIDPYFQLFVNRSFELLAGVVELPAINMRLNGDKEIIWVLPSQCVIAKDQFTRSMITEDLLLTHRNSYYLDDPIVNECDEKLLVALGCRILNVADILQLIETSYQTIDQEYPKNESTIKQAAQWLVCVSYYLQQRDKNENDMLKRLKQVKIFPVDSHKNLVSINEFHNKTILLPLKKTDKFAKNLKIVLEEIPAIDPRLIHFVEEQHPTRSKQFIEFLKKLGFQDNPRIPNLYNEYWLPTMSDPRLWATKSSDLLIAYFMCIFQYMYANEGNISDVVLNQLRKTLLVKTKQNKFFSLGSEKNYFHLTKTYGAKCSLENLPFNVDQYHFISDDYYKDYRSEEIFTKPSLHQKFSSFLLDLKINDFFQIESKDIPFAEANQVKNTKWASYADDLANRIHDSFIIRDYISEEFEALLSSNPDYQLCVKLFDYLNNSCSEMQNYVTASAIRSRLLKQHQQQRPEQGLPSSFLLSLWNLSWIPVGEGKLMKPSEVYLLPQSKDVFRRYVPHVDCSQISLPKNSSFIEILGIKQEIPAKILFDLLMKWSCDLDEQSVDKLIQSTDPSEAIPCVFDNTFKKSCEESLDNIRQIYDYLSRDKEICPLLHRFRFWPLVYLPTTENKGNFVFVRDVYWQEFSLDIAISEDDKNLKVRTAIGKYYKNSNSMEQLFIEVLSVEIQSNIDDYIPLLSTIENIDQRWILISILVQLAIKNKKEKELRVKCHNIAFIPCTNSTTPLAKYADNQLFFPNDPDLAKLFEDIVILIKLPSSKSVMNSENFCSIFKIKKLSEVIRTEVKATNEEKSTMITEFYEKSIDLIQNYLFTHNLIDQDRSKQLAEIFSKMRFVRVDSIRLVHCYENTNRELPAMLSTRDAFIDDKSAKFYILKNFENSEMRYIRTMAEFLINNADGQSGLISFIEELVCSYQRDPKQGLNIRRNELENSYEPKWFIPTEIVEEQQSEKKSEPKKNITISDEEIRAVANEESTAFKTVQDETADTTKKISVTSKLLQLPSDRDRTQHLFHGLTKSTSSPHEKSDNDETITEPKPKSELEYSPFRTIPDSIPLVRNDLAEKVQSIIVTNLDDFDFSLFTSTTNKTISIPNFNTTSQPGRVGEQIVYYVLKREHPTAKVIWENETTESMKPYDIYIERENGEKEFIEVKTTTIQNENSFFVSGQEVKFFLDHPENSSIYRVYHGDPIESSTITKINQIKDNLDTQNLKLVMTIFSKPN